MPESELNAPPEGQANSTPPTLEEARSRINEIADGLGLPVDKGIQEPLAALWANGIETTGSCEGHKDWGLPYPWIDIETPDPEGWEENEALQQEWTQANLAQAQIVRRLLDEFYSQQPSSQPLLLDERGIFGAMRLQPDHIDGGKYQDYEQARQDMAKFTEFLKSKLSKT